MSWPVLVLARERLQPRDPQQGSLSGGSCELSGCGKWVKRPEGQLEHGIGLYQHLPPAATQLAAASSPQRTWASLVFTAPRFVDIVSEHIAK